MSTLFLFLVVAILSFGSWKALSSVSTESITQFTSAHESAQQAPSQSPTIIAQNLDTPWALAFLPDNSLLFTERRGVVRKVSPEGELQEQPVAQITSVVEQGEGGLLGITTHPEFSNKPFVFLYYTYKNDGNSTLNRVVRMTYDKNVLSGEEVILDKIPGASNHDGGALAFGPDNFLYITTGDAQEPSRAQDTKSLAGKILRVTDEGKPAPGNPFNNEVYSYGHRNPQGIAWDEAGNLFATEHGRSGALSGLDELNKIEAGKNYGWPDIEGDKTREGMITPVLHSGGSTTWAPGGLAYLQGSLYFGGLRGEALFQSEVVESKPQAVKENFKNEFGRVRAVTVGPNNSLYFTTSNKDGRGKAKDQDDKILRLELPLAQ